MIKEKLTLDSNSPRFEPIADRSVDAVEGASIDTRNHSFDDKFPRDHPDVPCRIHDIHLLPRQL